MTCWVTRFCCNPRKGLQNSLSLLKVGRNIYIPIIDSPRFLGVTTGQLPMHRFGPSNLWQVDGCYQLLSGATAWNVPPRRRRTGYMNGNNNEIVTHCKPYRLGHVRTQLYKSITLVTLYPFMPGTAFQLWGSLGTRKPSGDTALQLVGSRGTKVCLARPLDTPDQIEASTGEQCSKSLYDSIILVGL